MFRRVHVLPVDLSFWLELGMDPESGPHAIGRGIGDEEAPDAPRDLWDLLAVELDVFIFICQVENSWKLGLDVEKRLI